MQRTSRISLIFSVAAARFSYFELTRRNDDSSIRLTFGTLGRCRHFGMVNASTNHLTPPSFYQATTAVDNRFRFTTCLLQWEVWNTAQVVTPEQLRRYT